MAESIPLTGGLGVESPDIIVYGAGRLLIDVFVEELTTEEGCFLGVEGPIEGDSFSEKKLEEA
jgi:hypothetical protein